MTTSRWCAICVVIAQRRYGRFNGTQGLAPAITRIRGVACCGVHAEPVLLAGDQLTELVDRLARDV